MCVARAAAHPGGSCCIPSSSSFHRSLEHSVLHLAPPTLVRTDSLLKCFSFNFHSFHPSLQRSCSCHGVRARGWVIFVFELWQLGACGSVSSGGNLIFSVRGWKIIQNLLRTAVVWAQEYNVIHWLYCKKSLLKMKMGNQFAVSILSCGRMEQWLWQIWRSLAREGARKAILFVLMGIFYSCSETETPAYWILHLLILTSIRDVRWHWNFSVVLAPCAFVKLILETAQSDENKHELSSGGTWAWLKP